MKIFIADHNEVFRLGLTMLLEDLYDDNTISDDASVNVMLDQADWKQTDLVILQQNSDKNHTETDRQGKENLFKSGVKILVLSDKPSFSHARHLFSQGIKGYVDRASSIDIISEAIARVLAGKAYIEPSLLIQYLGNNHIIPDKFFKTHLPRPLTGKELEIVTYLIKGFKTSEISKLLRKKATTISTQKASIYQKLGVSNVIELMQCMNGSFTSSIPLFQ